MVPGWEGAMARDVYHISGSDWTMAQVPPPAASELRKMAYCRLPGGWHTAKTTSAGWPGCTATSKQPLVVPPVRVAAGPPSGEANESVQEAPASVLAHRPVLVAAYTWEEAARLTA